MSKISKLRLDKGLTQKALADALGMTVAGFQNWEKGRNNQKSIERVAKLCSLFGCTPNDLMEG